MTEHRVAVVTGASSGIGAATARRLAADGFRVVLAARRAARIEALAKELNALHPLDGADGSEGEAAHRAYPLDVTDRSAVREFASALDRVDVLVNDAGGAFGGEYIEQADASDWERMYQVNVLGVLHVTQALLLRLRDSGAGTVLIVSSTAAQVAYEGGGGYAAAKHGAHALAGSLRLELCGEPIRVIEIAPGMVQTDEFALTRFRGDAQKAAAVYAGVPQPLTAEDVADTISWAVTRPQHVNVDLLVLRPLAQAAQHKVARDMR
jgi:NADP-dependent 3-hydroxy acid dehydrogenase YdfG